MLGINPDHIHEQLNSMDTALYCIELYSGNREIDFYLKNPEVSEYSKYITFVELV